MDGRFPRAIGARRSRRSGVRFGRSLFLRHVEQEAYAVVREMSLELPLQPAERLQLAVLLLVDADRRLERNAAVPHSSESCRLEPSLNSFAHFLASSSMPEGTYTDLVFPPALRVSTFETCFSPRAHLQAGLPHLTPIDAMLPCSTGPIAPSSFSLSERKRKNCNSSGLFNIYRTPPGRYRRYRSSQLGNMSLIPA